MPRAENASSETADDGIKWLPFRYLCNLRALRNNRVSGLLVKAILPFFALSSVFASYSAVPAVPANVVSIPLISDMTGSDWTSYPSVEVLGYHEANDGGGGFFDQQGRSCIPNGGTIFKDGAGNCFIRREAAAGHYLIGWFGAYGDGRQSTTGVANGTKTFTDGAAHCKAAATAGKTHMVIVPPIGTAHSQVNTTFTCQSDTRFSLANSPGWSADHVSYYIGHDDGVAFSKALTLVNSGGTLELTAPAYLITSLPSGLGSITASIVGVGAAATPPTLVLGGLNGTSNGMTLAASQQVQYWNFAIDCAFGGQDCLEWTTAISGASLRNLSVFRGQRDCFTIDGGSGSGIENVSADVIYIGHCGRHGFMVNQRNGAYFNAAALSAFNIRGISQRQPGGGCVHGSSTGQSLPVLVQNLECDAQYGPGGQSAYRPRPNAIYFDAGVWVWDFQTVTVENTGGTAICLDSCAAIAANFSSASLMTTMRSVYGSSYWATITQATGPVVAAGVLSLAASGSAGDTVTILRSQQHGALSGFITVNNNSRGNTSQELWQINSVDATPQYGKVGVTALHGIGAPFACNASSLADVTSVVIRNRSTSATTLTYSMTGTASPAAWNTN